ncbi:MAG: HDIG domain-containing protein, partial [Malacoplasma sp.]|nr:HDIG domain-containing protein [Malacoplasma sp.]
DKRVDYFSKSNNEQTKKIVFKNDNSYSLSEFEKKLNLEKIKLIDKFEEEMKKEIDQKAIYYLINAMEKQVENIVSSRFSFTIKLPDESLKGKIIGKDGRNKRHFEQTTKTDLIIEPNLSAVTISSPNPIRREKAKQTMEKLLETKNIDVTKISIIYEDVEKNFEKICFELGKKTLENKLKIFDINQELYPIVGKLNFRTSYSQNVLLHCTECALLAADLARELGIDETKAKKAAFFHDIGKAIDFEIDNDHVNSGVKLAKQYNLEEYIVNAIESHHNKVLAKTPYAALVKIVDKLSASRPGARFVSNEEYFKRIAELEKICKSFKGVSEAYAIKSGREIDVIVNPDELSDDECRILIKEMKFKLEENEIVNKQPIEITLIRKFVQKVITEGSALRVK